VQPYDRQRAMIERLFEGFESKLTSSKWAQLTKPPKTPPCATSTISCRRAF
jgi:hypothetical protein